MNNNLVKCATCCAVGTYECAKPVLNFKCVHPTLVYIDMCIIPEIVYLWNQGVSTAASCCGHGFEYGDIAVSNSSIDIMERLGYERIPNDYDVAVYKSKICTDEWAKIAYQSSMDFYDTCPNNESGKKWKEWVESYKAMKDGLNHGN